MITPSAVAHRVLARPRTMRYFEHARRARLGLSREAYAPTMGGLFAPMSEVAATNLHPPPRRVAAQPNSSRSPSRTGW